MQLYTKIYLWFFGFYDFDEYVECEICLSEGKSKKAVDIHHIFGRSNFKTNNLLYIMAVCRDCHENKVNDKQKCFKIHLSHMKKYIEEQEKDIFNHSK